MIAGLAAGPPSNRNNNNNLIPGPNTYDACYADADNAGVWREFGAWHTWAPMCERAPFSRDNHLGNSVPKAAESGTLSAQSRAPQFEWEVPGDVLWQKGWDEGPPRGARSGARSGRSKPRAPL